MERRTNVMDAGQLEARKARAQSWFEALRDEICSAFEALEAGAPAGLRGAAPGRFERTPWRRSDPGGAPGGGGIMSMLRGRLFEKAGVQVSTVFGEFAPEFRNEIPGAQEDPRFWASGISLIAHPRSPHVPAVHMNTRFVVTAKAWFGGGADLTPLLAQRRQQSDPDARDFHAAMKAACDAHAAVAPYEKYKSWCDEYFFLKHRNEPRGIGGIFYDDFSEGGFAAAFEATRNIGDHFIPAYLPIVSRRKGMPYGDRQREFQLYRRGRYVEFNLIYDRGTTFGLQSGGRTESILMSLPPLVSWRYDWRPHPGTA